MDKLIEWLEKFPMSFIFIDQNPCAFILHNWINFVPMYELTWHTLC